MLCADVETEIHDGLRRDEDEEKLPEIHSEAQQHEVAHGEHARHKAEHDIRFPRPLKNTLLSTRYVMSAAGTKQGNTTHSTMPSHSHSTTNTSTASVTMPVRAT